MRLPTKARYAVRALLDLAMNQQGDRPVYLKDVARRQGISERYLEQVLIPIRAAGLVRSTRGVKGGYLLTRPPAEITVLEIVEAAIGKLKLVECVEDESFCPRRQECVVSGLWKEATEAMRKALAAKTLADLAGEYGPRAGA
ncbi:MAG: Rrf2 family transcriptional regulator [Candidatus Geothermincolales bacterium]